MNKGDFHMHTLASDGTCSYKEVIDIAKSKGLTHMAISDHDTMSAIEPAIEYANSLGIRLIPALELTTLYNDISVHTLAYFKGDKYKSEEFKNELTVLENNRENRARKMVENLNEIYDFNLSYEKIRETVRGSIGRPHIAQAIVDYDNKYTFDYIFKHFINKKNPAYVENKSLSTLDAINLIHKFDGLAVLAHPILIKTFRIDDLLVLPFDGIEGIYSRNQDEDNVRFRNLAKRRDLILTAGSDFHTLSPRDTKHGKIADVYLEGGELERFISNF